MTQADEPNVNAVPQLVEFGPYRVIGTRYAGKNEHNEIPTMWQRDFLPRMQEVVKADGADFSVGLCHCLPEVRDGSFEYIAAVPTTADAPIPAAMVETRIAAATYIAFPVASLAELKQAWELLAPWLEAHPEWEGYCTPNGCDCATHPGFELYPATFGVDGKLFIYLPVRKKPSVR
ncbi:MAG TPA: effector binding domain-containing protein [Armatimonadota bacterium]|jgi:AraC family transcriptional regulator